MTTSFWLLILAFLVPQVLSEFECTSYNKTVSPGSCNTELQCYFDEAYLDRKNYFRYCRCRIIIQELPIPDNYLRYNVFYNICAEHKNELQELWMIEANLEYIDSVIFKKYPNLRRLNLMGNEMRLNFSADASKLTSLDVSYNRLHVVESENIKNLKSLKMVNISHNKLDKVNFCFQNLNELEEIYLNNNFITKIFDGEFEHLLKLKVLNLAYNFIVVFGLQLQNLEVLDVSNNDIKNIKANTFLTTRKLTSLDMSSNNLATIDDNNFPLFRNVEYLNLNNNSLTEQVINCENLQHLKQINILDLSENQISKIFNCTFSSLRKLTKLSLLANRIEMIPSGAFSALVRLEELDLAHNHLKDISSGTFDNNLELKKLNISSNDLTEFDIHSLEHNSKITHFDITKNKLQHMNLQELKDKLRGLQFLDIDNYLVRCEEYSSVLDYFNQQNVIFKSCPSKACCTSSVGGKFVIILVVVLAIAVLAVIVLIVVLCKVFVTKYANPMLLLPIASNPK